MEDPTFPFADTWHRSTGQLAAQCNRFEQRIVSVTKGLLEIGPLEWYYLHPQDTIPALLSRRPRFLHRTVADYPSSSGVLTCESKLNWADAYCKLSLAEIAAFDCSDKASSNFLYVLNMFRPAPRDGAGAREPSYSLLKQLEANFPVASSGFRILGVWSPPYRQELAGASLPHFFAYQGFISYVLTQIPWRRRTNSPVSDLNLLISWLYGDSSHNVKSESDVALRLQSRGLHFGDKVQLYSGDLNAAPGTPAVIATVWIVVVAMASSKFYRFLYFVPHFRLVPDGTLQPLLETLRTFLDDGADPDVVISLQPLKKKKKRRRDAENKIHLISNSHTQHTTGCFSYV